MDVLNPGKHYEMMTTKPIPGLVLKMAVPTIASMLVTAFYNLADTFFVSTISTSATGAIGIAFSMMALIQAVGMTFGMGAGSYISRLLGEKKVERASEATSTAFFSALFCGALLMILGIIFIDPLMRFLGATPTILPYARSYSKIVLIGAPYMTTAFVMNNNLRAEGDAFFSMIGICSGAVLNIALDALFVVGLGVGIQGAAFATLISQFVSFSILLSMFLRGKSILHISIKKVQLHWDMYREILKVGMPTFFRQGLASLSMVFLNLAAAPYGDAAIAAMSICIRVIQFMIYGLLGFGQGFQPVAGYNYGAKRYDRLWQSILFCIKIGLSVMTLLAVVCFIFAPRIMMFFRKEDLAVVAIGSVALRWNCAILPFQVMIIISNMLFQALGKGKKAALLALSRQGLCFIPLIFILPRLFGLLGVQISQPMADLATFCIALPLLMGTLGEINQLKKQMPREE